MAFAFRSLNDRLDSRLRGNDEGLMSGIMQAESASLDYGPPVAPVAQSTLTVFVAGMNSIRRPLASRRAP